MPIFWGVLVKFWFHFFSLFLSNGDQEVRSVARSTWVFRNGGLRSVSCSKSNLSLGEKHVFLFWSNGDPGSPFCKELDLSFSQWWSTKCFYSKIQLSLGGILIFFDFKQWYFVEVILQWLWSYGGGRSVFVAKKPYLEQWWNYTEIWSQTNPWWPWR